MRRIGKIGRRKVFSNVKNVNVKSLKNRSKLLDFWSGLQEWRVASPPIAISCFTFVMFVTYVTFVTNVTNDSLHPRDSLSNFHPLHPRSKFHSLHPLHPRSNFHSLHSLHPRLKFHSLHPRSNFHPLHPHLKQNEKKFWLRRTAPWTVFRSQNQKRGWKGRVT